MAKASTLFFKVDNSGAEDIATVADFTYVTVKVESSAPGTTRLIFNSGSGMLLAPGDLTSPILVPPGTQIRLTNTSSSGAEVSVALTPHPQALLTKQLEVIAGYLHRLACGLLPELGPDAPIHDEVADASARIAEPDFERLDPAPGSERAPVNPFRFVKRG